MQHRFSRSALDARSFAVDREGLARALRKGLRGEVRFDNGSRALYSTDASNFRQIPLGVVIPRNREDVVAAVAIARHYGAPVLPRGAGTSLAGQGCNVALVVDFSKYMGALVGLDAERRQAQVEPGLILDRLRGAAEKFHLTFGPDPASHNRCTLGGMIGNNSCGVHSLMAGKTADNIEALEVLTYDGLRMTVGRTSEAELESIIDQGGRKGEIYAGMKRLRDTYSALVRKRYPKIPRRVSGYNLDQLLPENGFHVARALVGSEGTCVTVLEASCKLIPSPPSRVLLTVAWPDIFHCADRVPQILAHRPIGLEGLDRVLVDAARRQGIVREGSALLGEGGAWLLCEFGASSPGQAEAQARGLMEELGHSPHPPRMRLFSDPQEAGKVWQVREASLGAISHVPGEPLSWGGWEDSSVAPEDLGAYLRELRRLMDRYGYSGALYGHFGHACVHTRTNFDLESKAGIAQYRRFMEEAADLVVGYGGSLSGEHGDGQQRAELLPRMFGEELVGAFCEFKALWDPQWKMNPGKLVEPYKLDENLRLGVEYRPWQPATHFQFPEDQGSLAQATQRCVGFGKCRQQDAGLMCPSFQVTGEELHSTRGRARLLWEMTQGTLIEPVWNNEAVKESLDLCLACKGCKSECPVGVDVATYKAEFLSHYYQRRSRPRSAYAFAYIDRWARWASHAPGLVNLATQLPLASSLLKRAANLAGESTIPPFAPHTFRDWFKSHCLEGKRRGGTGPGAPADTPVLLWTDTFNNHFLPDTLQAAVEVLESARFRVLLPPANLCCGRPLYDFGMLERARRLLAQILDQLAPAIAQAIPIVVLEPSCAAVFRDELLNLFPRDPRARQLARQTFLLSEFLEQSAPHFVLPRLSRKALVHGHCHHKALMKMTANEAVLTRMEIAHLSPAAGCCGMAGSFGFEKHTQPVSRAIGELELLPAVRKAPPEWLIIADGFSCREQIAQSTERGALHLAEVIQMGLRERYEPIPPLYPESLRAGRRRLELRRSMRRAGLGLVGLSAGTAALWMAKRT